MSKSNEALDSAATIEAAERRAWRRHRRGVEKGRKLSRSNARSKKACANGWESRRFKAGDPWERYIDRRPVLTAEQQLLASYLPLSK